MPPSYAYATLLTTDSYLPGALVLAGSIRMSGTPHALIALYTPTSVSPSSVASLHRLYDHVLPVPTFASNDSENLTLLGRLDLGETWTKLHVFDPRVVGDAWERILFCDADVLVLRNVDEVFAYLDGGAVFAAAPDVGWPDCFNSGVFVCRPGQEVFEGLREASRRSGSFDGGDQGLLNTYFSGWASGSTKSPSGKGTPPTARLPFTYNVTPSAFYSYLPAYMHYYRDISVVHFIGAEKPWMTQRRGDGSVVQTQNMSQPTYELYRKWWQVYDRVTIRRNDQQYQSSTAKDKGSHSQWTGSSQQQGNQNRGNQRQFFDSGNSGGGGNQDMHEFSHYRCVWNEAELSPSKSSFQEREVQLVSPSIEQPEQNLMGDFLPLVSVHDGADEKDHKAKVGSLQQSADKDQSKVAPLQAKSPKVKPTPISPETKQPSGPTPYETFERSLSPHGLTEPSTDLGNYRVSWNAAELGRKALELADATRADNDDDDDVTLPPEEVDSETLVAHLRASRPASAAGGRPKSAGGPGSQISTPRAGTPTPRAGTPTPSALGLASKTGKLSSGGGDEHNVTASHHHSAPVASGGHRILTSTTVVKKIITKTVTNPDGTKTVTQEEIVTQGEPVLIASAADKMQVAAGGREKAQ